jgi:hypothetical protein
MNTPPQRDSWDHTPRELETVWTLSKGHRTARLVLYTHQFGWELRIESGDLLMTQVTFTPSSGLPVRLVNTRP